MSADEETTHATYTSHLVEVFRPKVTGFRGRIVKSTGDGFVAEFESVVNAVECAADIQAEISERNTGESKDRRIDYRIGINLGDIIVEHDDIYGDGVNIASRLQELAPTGGVCVSRQVYEQVHAKSSLRFRDLGRRRVKNVADPIRAYSAMPAGVSPGLGAPWVIWVEHRRLAIGTVAAVIVLGGGAMLLDLDRLRSWTTPETPPTVALSVPADKPSIAVLAFRNMSNDQRQQYFAEGIADDITTDLSKLAGLFVVSRRSSFAYRESGKDPETIARELGVRYLLKGSVRRSGDMVRINTQLIDATSGLHVWAARHDSPISEIFAVEDKISREIVSALSARIKTVVQRQPKALGTTNVAAYDAYLQGWAQYRRLDSSNHGKAVAFFETAIKLDANYAQAHAALAATYLAIRNNAWTLTERYTDPLKGTVNAQKHSGELIAKARAHLERAQQRPTPLSLRVSSEVLTMDRRYDEAIQYVVNAIALDPNDADSYAQLGLALIWAGRAAEAIEPLNKAMRLNPHYPVDYLALLGIAHFVLRDYARAVDLLQKSVQRNPRSRLTLTHLMAAYGHLDRPKEAKQVLFQMNAVLFELGYPEFTVKQARRVLPYRNGRDLLHLLMGLHKAGVPDHLLKSLGPGKRM